MSFMPNFFRKYSIVDVRPCSSDTFGSHPRSVRARSGAYREYYAQQYGSAVGAHS